MSKVTCDISVSLDGFAAGPHQSLENPLGEGAEGPLHRWMFEESERHGDVLKQITDAKAFVMGRNMFGPGRGTWDLQWKGWWGEEPPYHAPVFVLTHHPREPLPMAGGTTFYFVTAGIESALQQAQAAAQGGNVAIAGGAQTVNQYLAAGLLDELRLHIAPVVLGAGERLFEGVQNITLQPLSVSGTELVTHISYRVQR
ncbi:MAG: dihydrofolate reductase family protein [Ardenticatenaceae bacterium]